MYAVRRVAVHAGDLTPRTVSGQMALLLLRMAAVTAEGEHQRNVLPLDTGVIQLVQQGGHHLPCGHGAGNIAGDDGNLLAGVHDVPQPGRTDGLVQRPPDLRLAGQRHRHLVGRQDALQICLRPLHRFAAGADLQSDVHK